VGIVVQKYGGSSVADVARIEKVADRVAATRERGQDVVVVVSAMGRHDRRAARARAPHHRPPGPPRARHAALRRRAHLDGAASAWR
jgi:aspartate kinase